MKRMRKGGFLICIVLMFKASVLIAQFSVGKYVQFPDGGFTGSAYKPGLAIAQQKNDTVTKNYVALHFTSSQDYADFDASSRLLIKFSDDSKSILPIYTHPLATQYATRDFEYLGSAKLYSTYSMYVIDSVTLSKILSDNKIVKIRIVFTNGDIKDYFLDDFYQSKFIKKLKESYFEATGKNLVREKNMDDSDF